MSKRAAAAAQGEPVVSEEAEAPPVFEGTGMGGGLPATQTKPVEGESDMPKFLVSKHLAVTESIENDHNEKLIAIQRQIADTEADLHGSQDETDKAVSDIENKARRDVAELKEKQVQKDTEAMKHLADLRGAEEILLIGLKLAQQRRDERDPRQQSEDGEDDQQPQT